MDQLDIAIHQTAHDAPGGLEALARRMGMGAQVLRNKVCPTTDTHKLNLREALAIMEITGDDRILQVIAAQRGYTLARIALPDAASIIDAVLSADAEHGGVAQHIRAAIADGKLTEAERAAVTAQIKRAHDTLDSLHSTVLHAPTLLKQG
ncbi:MAG: hypothetical protein A2143_08075 [Gallionellales bacterium RBG_16_57_15]|nr:MAG: hypothetical protein A2143_08075 [Gallionellales bacterium RBG_16_57_15]